MPGAAWPHNQAASGTECPSGRHGPIRLGFALVSADPADAVEDQVTLPMGLDRAGVFRSMVRMRLVEEALTQAWADGLVPGE